MLRGVARYSSKSHVAKNFQRHASNENQSLKVPLDMKPQGRAGRKLLMFLAGTMAGSGGVLVYASKNDQVREILEANIPNSKEAIDAAARFSAVITEYYKKLSSASPSNSLPSPMLPGLSKELPKSEHSNKVEVISPTQSDSAPSKTQEQVMETVTIAPAPVKKEPDVLFATAMAEIENAIGKSKEFIDSFCHEVSTKTETASSNTIDELRKMQVARAEELVKELRAEYSETLDKALSFQLDSAVQKLNVITLEVEALKVYARNYAEKLEQELTAVGKAVTEAVFIPLDKVNENKLGKKEFEQFIAFGYRQLKMLQEELEKHHATGKTIMKDILESRKSEMESALTAQFQADLASVKRELEGAKEREISQTEQRLTELHNAELARQAAAHAQHLQDVLEVQERQLRARFETNVQELLALERSKQQNELAILIARVSAIRKILTDRAEIDRVSSRSHQLWISTQALHDELFCADNTKSKVQLKPMLDSIQSSFGEDPYVSALISQFNEKEVTSQSSLSARFKNVRRVCRRVALVPDPPTFSSYIWSYLRATFIFDPPALSIKVDASGDKYVDAIDQPDTLTILTTAQQLLDNNELELCVRVMNQLSGEARNVARDWIAEARKLLELRQAANGLLAFAAANSAVGFLTYQGLK